MSVFFSSKPYVLSRGEMEQRACVDFLAFITAPLWLPIAGLALAGTYAHGTYIGYRHKQRCSSYISKLRDVTITDNSVYWRKDNTIYIVTIHYNGLHLDLSTTTVESTIRQTWMKGINYVLAAMKDPSEVTEEFINYLEAIQVPDGGEDKDTIVLDSGIYANIGNMITYTLADGYYGIFANKFHIVHSYRKSDSVTVT